MAEDPNTWQQETKLVRGGIAATGLADTLIR